MTVNSVHVNHKLKECKEGDTLSHTWDLFYINYLFNTKQRTGAEDPETDQIQHVMALSRELTPSAIYFSSSKSSNHNDPFALTYINRLFSQSGVAGRSSQCKI